MKGFKNTFEVWWGLVVRLHLWCMTIYRCIEASPARSPGGRISCPKSGFQGSVYDLFNLILPLPITPGRLHPSLERLPRALLVGHNLAGQLG